MLLVSMLNIGPRSRL